MEQYNLPQGWAWATFDDSFGVIPVTNSKILQSQYLLEGKVAVIDQGQHFIGGYTNDVDKQVDTLLPVIIFGDHTTVVKYVDFNFVAGADGVKVLRPSELFVPKFLYYFLQIAEIPNRGYGRHFQYLRQLEIPLPPLAEQGRIVAAIEAQLSRIEAGVAAVRNAQSALRRYKASVLNAACTGQLVAQEPSDEPAGELLQRILVERRERWEADQQDKAAAKGKPLPKGWKDKYPAPAAPVTRDLPPLSQGWVWGSFDQILSELKNGYFGGRPATEPPGIPILRINSVRPLLVTYDSTSYIRDITDQRVDSYLLKNGDLLFTRYNGTLELVGVCGMVRGIESMILYPDKLIRVRVLVVPNYLEIYFATSIPRRIIESKAKSTAGQTGIAGNELRILPVALPPLEEQARIVAEVERRLSVVAALEATVNAILQRAAWLRQSVLRRAFRGELVAQDPNDENASILIERTRSAKIALQENNTNQKANKPRRQPKMAQSERRALVDILSEADGPILAEELFRMAGFTVSTAQTISDIEEYFEELRRIPSIIMTTTEDNKVLLEVEANEG